MSSYNVGDVVGHGTMGDLSWDVAYVGEIAMAGLGPFNWRFEIRRGNTTVMAAFMLSDKPEQVVHLAKLAFNDLAATP
ncbi:MAG TPA: hypothetical protein VF815_29880 [Myxococcaceae bacterium]|jgi:hypothetical protein